jgi:hypothetical protein
MGVESYLHKYAKVVVSSWLRKKIRIGKKFKGMSNLKLDLDYEELKKQKPMLGVYMEYPVCKDMKTKKKIGIDIMWNKWLVDNNLDSKVKSKSRIPTSYELKDIESYAKVVGVFDIGIITNNKLKYVIEIEHKHPTTPKKIKFIQDNNIKGYEISAQKVMEQVQCPFTIDCLNEW